MNPQAHCTRFESVCPDWNLVPSEESEKEGELLTEIEEKLWDALDFNDICSVMAEEDAIDQKAFVQALQGCDSERGFSSFRTLSKPTSAGANRRNTHGASGRLKVKPQTMKRWKWKRQRANGGWDE
jgi:hypothetical protein